MKIFRILMLVAAIVCLTGTAYAADTAPPATDTAAPAASSSTTDPGTAPATTPPNCKKGKLCGNTCIAKSAVCHKDKKPKNCKKGKLCGDTCIAKDKECHIK